MAIRPFSEGTIVLLTDEGKTKAVEDLTITQHLDKLLDCAWNVKSLERFGMVINPTEIDFEADVFLVVQSKHIKVRDL